MPRVVFEGPTVDCRRGEYDDELLITATIMVDGRPMRYGGSVRVPCPARDVVDAVHAAKLVAVGLRDRDRRAAYLESGWPEPERTVLREALEDDDPVCEHCGTKDGAYTCAEADRGLFSCTNFRGKDG